MHGERLSLRSHVDLSEQIPMNRVGVLYLSSAFVKSRELGRLIAVSPSRRSIKARRNRSDRLTGIESDPSDHHQPSRGQYMTSRSSPTQMYTAVSLLFAG